MQAPVYTQSLDPACIYLIYSCSQVDGEIGLKWGKINGTAPRFAFPVPAGLGARLGLNGGRIEKFVGTVAPRTESFRVWVDWHIAVLGG